MKSTSSEVSLKIRLHCQIYLTQNEVYIAWNLTQNQVTSPDISHSKWSLHRLKSHSKSGYIARYISLKMKSTSPEISLRIRLHRKIYLTQNEIYIAWNLTKKSGYIARYFTHNEVHIASYLSGNEVCTAGHAVSPPGSRPADARRRVSQLHHVIQSCTWTARMIHANRRADRGGLVLLPYSTACLHRSGRTEILSFFQHYHDRCPYAWTGIRTGIRTNLIVFVSNHSGSSQQGENRPERNKTANQPGLGTEVGEVEHGGT